MRLENKLVRIEKGLAAVSGVGSEGQFGAQPPWDYTTNFPTNSVQQSPSSKTNSSSASLEVSAQKIQHIYIYCTLHICI
jgi:hypothetical protein